MSSVLDEVLEGFEPSPQIVSVMGSTRPAVVLSLDIGTSGIRAGLFDELGHQIEGANVRLRRSTLDDLTSLDAEESLTWTAKAIDELLKLSEPQDLKLELISISCFWHSLVGVDANAHPTTPVFTWANTQATAAARELRRKFDEAAIHNRTGCRFHPSYWPAKLSWLRQEQPKIFATSHWMSFGEFLVLRLFGETAASISMASGTGLFDQRTCEWDTELAAALEIEIESLPQLADCRSTFYGLTSQYATRWPQLAEARIYPAIGDGAANTIGSGCVARNKWALMMGSSGALRMLYDGEPPAQLPAALWCYRADKRRVVLGGAMSDGGNLYAWLRDSLMPSDDNESIERSLALIEPDAHGLTVLPFWSGERSTGWSLDAKGAILGLTSNTQPIEILRAGMEAIAYRLAHVHQALAMFASDATIVASGTALHRSPVWIQILADVLGQPITLSPYDESSTRGAALLALEAAGKIANIETQSVVAGTTFEPDMSRHVRYQAAMERQQQVYTQLIGEI